MNTFGILYNVTNATAIFAAVVADLAALVLVYQAFHKGTLAHPIDVGDLVVVAREARMALIVFTIVLFLMSASTLYADGTMAIYACAEVCRTYAVFLVPSLALTLLAKVIAAFRQTDRRMSSTGELIVLSLAGIAVGFFMSYLLA